MPGKTITDVDILQQYIVGVMDRADHHAGNVSDVCLAIAGALIWRKQGDIQVYERQGNMANALWVTINGNQYAVSYNHQIGVIEIRQKSMRGAVLRQFDNKDSAADVRKYFASL